MKRLIILILSLSLIIQLIIPALAFAESNYAVIKKTSSLYLPKIRDNGRDCSNSEDGYGDITNNYMYFLERAVNRTRDQYKQQMIGRYLDFKTIVDTEGLGYWAIFQRETHIYFVFSRKEDFRSSTLMNVLYFSNKPNKPFEYIDLGDHRGCNYRPLLSTSGDNLSHDSYYQIYTGSKVLVNNFPINYPKDYNGERFDNLILKKDITPSVHYSVNGLKLDAFLCTKQFQNLCKPMFYPWGRNTKFKYEIKNNPTDQKPIYSSGDLSLADSLHFT